MPSKSKKQAKFMRAVAHGWKPSKTKGPTRAVAREFMNADRRKKVDGYQFGGMAAGMGSMMDRFRQQQRGGGPQPGGGGGPLRQIFQRQQMAMRNPRERLPSGGGPRGPGGGMDSWGRATDPRRRGAPPPQRGGGRFGSLFGARGQPQGGGGGRGGLSQMMQQMMQRQQGQGGGGIRGMMNRMRGQQQGQMPPNKGPRIAPPPGKYPGGGNPNLGGRNPMIRGRGRFGGAGRFGRGATSNFR